VLLAAGVFAAVAGPWGFLLSVSKGRLLFSDSPRLTIMWHVSGRTVGRRLHPPRVIWQSPKVLEFAEPVAGTYPLWRDPSYWTEGLRPVFDLHGHLRQLRAGLVRCMQMGAELCSGVFVAGVLAGGCWLVLKRHRGRVRVDAGCGEPTARLRPALLLVLPSLAGAGMFCLVLVEPRYVCGFLLVLAMVVAIELASASGPSATWLGWTWAAALLVAALWQQPRLVRVAAALVLLATYASARLGRLRMRRPLPHRMVLGLPLVVLAGLSVYAACYVAVHASEFAAAVRQRGESAAVAAELRAAGIGHAAVVAIGGPAYDWYWLRLARLRVVAEVDRTEVSKLWQLDAAERKRLFERLARTGARLAVSTVEPPPDWRGHWLKLAGRVFVIALPVGHGSMR